MSDAEGIVDAFINVTCVAPGSVVPHVPWGHLVLGLGREPRLGETIRVRKGPGLFSFRVEGMSLAREIDRYIDINSRLGAENEGLRDQVDGLMRYCDEQAEMIRVLRDEAFARSGLLRLPTPYFCAERPRERLSASWEHLPDPCVPDPPPPAALPTMPLRALRQGVPAAS